MSPQSHKNIIKWTFLEATLSSREESGRLSAKQGLKRMQSFSSKLMKVKILILLSRNQ